MFHVEHTMKRLKIMALVLFISGCTKNDPHPELLDSIYKDLVVELDIASKGLDEEEKNLISVLKEKSMAIPQTGQIKFANKKVADSYERLNILSQRKKFFEIKIAQRVQFAQLRHDESRRPGGKPWPDPEEQALYSSVAKFQRDKLVWEKNKGMKKTVPRGTAVK